jgi:hypothetical protein
MRLSINVSEETNERLTQQAKKIGTSKGAMITMWINEKLNNIDSTEKFFNGLFDSPLFKEMMSKEMAEKFEKEFKKNEK